MQFSLRGLLLLIAICSIWLGIAFHRARQQARAVAAIQAAGGYVFYDYEGDSNGTYENSGVSKVPNWLLDSLGLDFFHHVTVVQFSDSPPVDDREYLRVTDDLLANLKALPEIVELYIDSFAGTNEGLKHISFLSNLRLLHININNGGPIDIDDDGLAALSRLRNLQHLAIFNAPITDRGLCYLKALTNLNALALGDTQVTMEGAEDLFESLPECAISVYGGGNDVFTTTWDPTANRTERAAPNTP